MVPECERHKAIVINNSGSRIEGTIRLGRILGEPVIWSGQLERYEARHVASHVSSSGYHELRGRYLANGDSFSSGSSYAFGHGQMISVFIVKDDGVEYGYWDERGPPPDVEYGDDFALPRIVLYFLPDLLKGTSKNW